MTNEERSKLRREALEVKEEKKVKKGFFTSTRNKIIAGITLAFTVAASSAGAFAVANHINNDAAVADTTVEDTKEIPNDNYYIESETKELEQKITDYFNSLDTVTKNEFNNNPQYLIDFGKWINGLKIDNFSEDYILQIYEMINNANDNVKTAYMNNKPIEGQMIKASTFIKPTNVNIELFTERERYLDEIMKDPYGPNAFEVAKKWFTSDWNSLLGLNGAKKFSDLDSQTSELALAVNTFEMQNLVDKIFQDNNCNGLNLQTPDGSEAFYPLVLEAHESLGIEIEDESEIDHERFYKNEITRLLTHCDNYVDKEENDMLDDQNSYGILLEVQNRFINEEIIREKTESTDTSKLEEITTAKENAYLLKEMAFNYRDKNGTKVRVHSNIINS